MMFAAMEQSESVSVVQPVKKKSELWGWIRFVIYLAAAYFIIMNVIGLTRVSGHSMNPSLNHGNVLLVNKWSTYLGQPEYGDVIVIHSPKLSYDIVKRVIAVEGDRVAIAQGVVYVNGQALPELYTFGASEDMAEIAVGVDEVFVLGDNRAPGESLDSRSEELGLIHEDDIKGYALRGLIPWRGIPGPLGL